MQAAEMPRAQGREAPRPETERIAQERLYVEKTNLLIHRIGRKYISVGDALRAAKLNTAFRYKTARPSISSTLAFLFDTRAICPSA
jgi:hypothetical protein